MTLNIKQNKGVDLICVCDVPGLMTILEIIHYIRYHHIVHPQRYDPFTCVYWTRESPFDTGTESEAFVSMMLL